MKERQGSGTESSGNEPSRHEIDWKALVRRHLPASSLSAEAEADLVEELAQILQDASHDADVDLSSEASRVRWFEQQIPEWDLLTRAPGRRRRRDLWVSSRPWKGGGAARAHTPWPGGVRSGRCSRASCASR